MHVASNGEESTMMWHLKLGHMSEQCLKILSEQKLLSGFKTCDCSGRLFHKMGRGEATNKYHRKENHGIHLEEPHLQIWDPLCNC